MRAVIAIAGPIASGKTTIAHALARHLGAGSVVRSFGDVVRARARRDGLPADRAFLQAVGLMLIREGWPSFIDVLVRDLPDQTDTLIVDGVRHVEALEELRRHWPGTPVRLVVLIADPTLIEARLADRGEPASGDHDSESHLDELAATAVLALDASLSPPTIVERLARLGIAEPNGPSS